MQSENPFLEIRFRIPFDRIQASDVEPAIAQLLARSREAQAALAANTDTRTYENTMLALERMTENLDYAMGVIRHLESVATYPEFRAAHNAIQEEVSKYYSGIELDPGLWCALKEFSQTEEARNLEGPKLRFLTKTIDAFRRHGAELDEAGKKKLEEIDVQLTVATTKFSENVLDATNAFELLIGEEAKLAGLPPTARSAAKASAESRGLNGWRFTLQQPSLTPLLTYLDDREIRRQVWFANATRASAGAYDNSPILSRILSLRREKAQLLGFSNFADLVLYDRMAKTGAQARRFLDGLYEKTKERFEIENRELQEFRNRLEGAAAPRIEPWDVAYYAEKMRESLYDFDEEALRPYFSLNSTVQGMYEMVRCLYGIEVKEEPGAPVWDKDVKYYSIYDSDGARLGSFYADWHPRENKRPGAWMDAFLTGTPRDGVWEPHLGLICGNLTPPAAGSPALLTHREVETIFHEFGHLLHHLLSRVEVKSLAGTNVAWDFVELPSQIMENWCWERECLDMFARHHETGEPIPGELFDKMKRARTFRAANAQMRPSRRRPSKRSRRRPV